jgi:wobble nucleotide-excising tRNase
MITKINKIKDFGVFKNFSGASLPEFKTFNLIYGWNYSGKTTLSRVFKCLEKGQIHEDYKSATFEFEGQSVMYDNLLKIKPNIKVFNSDFIKENLKWDSDKIEPIFILGQENIDLQEKLSKKEIALDIFNKDLLNFQKNKDEKNNKINKSLTDKAREITNILTLGRGFDRDKLKQLVESVNSGGSQYSLTPNEHDKFKTQAISTDRKPQMDEINIRISNLSPTINTVKEILERQSTSEKKIQKLLDNKSLGKWVEDGKYLHEQKNECEFCGNKLPTDLIDRLNKHFSKDYEILKQDIEGILRNIQNLKISPIIQLPAITAFYIDILPDFEREKPILENEISKYNAEIEKLILRLEEKREKPFDKLEIIKVVDNKEEIEASLKNINKVINRNNKRTDDFSVEKNNSIEKLKCYYALQFENEEQYTKIQNELIKEQSDIQLKEAEKKIIEEEILKIKEQLNETVKGAGKVNEYLKIFFGKDDIKIEPTPDKKFKLLRGNDVAKNLSEGEKTSISFAYFATKLEEQNNKILDSIVYIDDPISSLDSNHLFNIYSFIKNMFYETTRDQNGSKIHVCKCKQLFISTHSFEFYNLIYDWFNDTKKNQTPHEYFIVERTKNETKNESKLKESNHLIHKYKSEYVYLFFIIYNFSLNPSDNFENLYNLPNILRRFVETYLNFKYLSSKNIEESIDSFITNSIERERARKFMHYYSHSLTTDKFMKFADLAECIDVVKIILESVKSNDKTHFDSLVSSLI